MFSDIFYFLITLSILVTFHEYGHYWVARRCGVKVLAFSVGFGNPIWQKKNREGTNFMLATIPLGGYVRMLDEREGPVPEELRSQAFNNQSRLKRAAIVSAGPIANFLLACVIYWLAFLVGVPGEKPIIGDIQENSPFYETGIESGSLITSVDGQKTLTKNAVNLQLAERLGDTGELTIVTQQPGTGIEKSFSLPIERWLAGEEFPDIYGNLGFQYSFPPIQALIKTVVKDGPASRAGLMDGDLIISIDDQRITEWRDAVDIISQSAGELISIEVERNQAFKVFELEVESLVVDGGERKGRIGIMVDVPPLPEEYLVIERLNLFEGFIRGVEKTGDMIVFTLVSLKKLVVGLISPSNLSGPITIAKIASTSASAGLVDYLMILALLSVSLGVFNLLPVPVLDGGHLLLIAIESLRGKPLSENALIVFQQMGLVVILMLMSFAIYNDIHRFF